MPKKKVCPLCTEQIRYVDYKNTTLLRRFISHYNKIQPRYYTGMCLQHQKDLARAIKNARIVGLLPFVE